MLPYKVSCSLDIKFRILIYTVCSSIATVPKPDILLLKSDEEHYAGSSLTLTCKTELRSTVDTGVIVATRWRKGGMDITASDHILVSSTSQTGAWTYESTVSLNPLSQVLHAGLYKCEVSVHSYPPSSFVLLATNSAMQSIDIQSKYNSFI